MFVAIMFSHKPKLQRSDILTMAYLKKIAGSFFKHAAPPGLLPAGFAVPGGCTPGYKYYAGSRGA